MTKTIFERHYILRLQKPFSRKMGGACPTFPTSLIFLNNVMYQQIVLRFQGILFSGATGFRQEMKTVLALLLF